MPLLLPHEPWGPRDDTYDTNPVADVQVAGSATANTLGTVTEIIAATKCDADCLLIAQTEQISLAATNTATLATFYVDTGAGDQAVIGPVDFGGDTAVGGLDMASMQMYPLWVPKGAQILAAVQGAQTNKTATFRIWPVNWRGMFRGGRRCVNYGALTATSRGTQVTGGSSAWGSWVQITASTTMPCKWIVPSWGQSLTVVSSTLERHLQIGVGASGSEVVIGGPWHATSNTAEVFERMPMWPARVDLPAGVRLSARVWNTATVGDAGVCLHTFF